MIQIISRYGNMLLLAMGQNLMLAPVDLKKSTKEEARKRAIQMLEKVGMQVKYCKDNLHKRKPLRS